MTDSSLLLKRRTVLLSAAALASSPVLPALAHGLHYGAPAAFSFDGLVRRAQALAHQPYQAPARLDADLLHAIDYDAWGAVRFNTADALFANGPGRFPITFFPLGRYFQEPTRLYLVAGAAGHQEAREIQYRASDFTIPAGNPARRLPADAGFAGFRFQESRLGDQKAKPWQTNDWAAFLGASYFRAIGALYQYGISARGIAINTAVAGVTEEFPRFTHFYFATPTDEGPTVTVYALLNGPSVSGAYRFTLTRERAVLMDVAARIFLRQDVLRFGMAPLTSMYWFSESCKPTKIDWRPEVHDSGGLSMWNGAGERLWRPLAVPAQPVVSAFSDHGPHGFGLSQRDRDFNHYLDGVFYNRRPTLWVEPQGDWGPGAVQLVELPTRSEFEDNISAMWVPQAPARAGADFDLKYRLYWVADAPFPPPLALCRATRLGLAYPEDPKRQHIVRFVVEFQGAPLAQLASGDIPEAVVTAAQGKIAQVRTEAVPDDVPGHWRARFELEPAGADVVELRLFLRDHGRALTETWLYTWRPTSC